MKITNLRTGTEKAIETIVPYPYQLKEVQSVTSIPQDDQIVVMIKIVGDLSCHLLLQANQDFFANLGESMFGMSLDPPLLESFIGEFGNMVGGNLAIQIQDQLQIDISPPSVYMNSPFPKTNFKDAICLPLIFHEDQLFRIYYLFDDVLQRDGDKRVG